MGPVMSIIIPALDVDQALCQTLATIPESNVEVVIVSGDTDGDVPAWLVRKGVKVVRAKRRGIYNAMNIGIGESSGEYLFFCGAGDRLIASTLNELIAQIQQGRYSSRELIVAPVIVSGPMRIRYPSLMCRPEIIHHQGCIFPKKLLNKHRLYDERFILHGDWDLICRVSAQGGIRKFLRPICCFAPGGRSTSGENSFVTICELTRVMLAHGSALRPSSSHLIMLARPIYYYIRKFFARSANI